MIIGNDKLGFRLWLTGYGKHYMTWSRIRSQAMRMNDRQVERFMDFAQKVPLEAWQELVIATNRGTDKWIVGRMEADTMDNAVAQLLKRVTERDHKVVPSRLH